VVLREGLGERTFGCKSGEILSIGRLVSLGGDAGTFAKGGQVKYRTWEEVRGASTWRKVAGTSSKRKRGVIFSDGGKVLAKMRNFYSKNRNSEKEEGCGIASTILSQTGRAEGDC